MFSDLHRFMRAYGRSLAGVAFGGALLFMVALFVYSVILLEASPSDRPRWSENWLWIQAGQIAKFGIIGLFTALFTRLFGVMGMFRTAIADLFGDDRWLDLRTDLDVLWCKISNRLFMPGFSEQTPGASRLLDAVNSGMARLLSTRPKSYFARNVKRTIKVKWADPERRDDIIIIDRVQSELVPYVPRKPFSYRIKFAQTVDGIAHSSSVELSELTIDGQDMRTSDAPDHIEIELDGSRDSHQLVREMRYRQTLAFDPIFLFDPDHVSLGHTVVVSMDADAQDLLVNFEEIGAEGLFSPVDETNQLIWRLADPDRAVLPHQGYMLVFTRRGTGTA